MEYILVAVFVLGYLGIALEHNIKIDKAASALLTGTILWGLFVLGYQEIPPHLADMFANFAAESHGGHGSLSTFYEHRLMHHMQDISSILFFLLGAMTIVELVDAHEGFRVITDKINTTNKVKLMWIICILTFFFSALLDNLTTSIVIISLLRKLIDDKETRWLFAGMVVVSANAGGAWSPIGDVTTTMLWIGGQLSTSVIIVNLILPSLVAMLVPLAVLTLRLKGEVARPVYHNDPGSERTTKFERNMVFAVGLGGLLFVPVFKTATHLPPFMGMMMSLGMIWLITERLHHTKNVEHKSQLSVIGVLRKIDTASVLFFLGILLAVSALQEAGHLILAATSLRESLNNVYLIDMAIGLLSAIVDNVPLVAASMGMYEIVQPGMVTDAWSAAFVQDGAFWQFLAYCAGTGGSALIIGSAAGVAVMGLERIDFVWYVKNISLLAILGYFAGAGVYLLMFAL
ncbi:MAG: sodium:proton antiporter NhaD [Bacteroidetes bacterium]|nr:sodium:proton antiporter NhaD [Bacteroidota bacterium]